MLVHANNDLLFLSLLLVPVPPIITLSTVPENPNPRTTNEVTVLCSVVSHPQIEESSLTLAYGEINFGAHVAVSNLIEVSFVVLDVHGLMSWRIGVRYTYVTKLCCTNSEHMGKI